MSSKTEPVGSPPVAVAIASFRDPELLDACLASVLPQTRAAGGTVFVARAASAEPAGELAARYPDVVFLPVDAPVDGSGVPELRGGAMRAAAGGAPDAPVALTEDHCVAQPDWLEWLSRHLDGTGQVIGGAMWNARGRAVDWGAYFAEYGFFGPAAPKVPAIVTGANALYSADLVTGVARQFSEGAWENVVHDRLAAQGTDFRFEPRAVISQNKRYGFADFCRDRFTHGRAYARDRLAEEGSGRRAAYLAGAPALPFLLTARVGRAAGSRAPRTFMKALPFTFAFLGAWSMGELSGYLSSAGGSHG